MINTTIFKSAFIFLVVVSSAMGHPVEKEVDNIQSSKPPTEETAHIAGDHYDQRQNGTKNFRLNVDGVVVVVAPLEALLFAGDLDSSLLSLGQERFGEAAKPGTGKSEILKTAGTEKAEKPMKEKSAHSHESRLSNLLGSILRRISI